VKVKGSITITVTGFDSGGGSLGDVTDLAWIESSVITDDVIGNTITFRHASPHVITARLGNAVASVTIQVQPAAATAGALSLTGSDILLPAGVLTAVLIVGGGLLIAARGRGRRPRGAHVAGR
jgi:hypothetical protein